MINFPRSILEHGSTFPRVVNGLISLWDDRFGTLRTCAGGGGGGGESVQIVKGKSVCVSVFKLLSLLQVIFIYHLWYVFSLFTISAVIFLSNINFSSFVYYFLVFHVFYYVVCFRLKLFFPPPLLRLILRIMKERMENMCFWGISQNIDLEPNCFTLAYPISLWIRSFFQQ